MKTDITQKDIESMVLVIIDMQKGFHETSEEPSVVKHCAAWAKRFREANRPVLLVEYEGFKDTLDLTTSELKGHKSVKKVLKCRNNGSEEIKATLKANGFEFKKLLVCGVNIQYCVYETVDGLHDSDINIVIAQKACNGIDGPFEPTDYVWKERFAHMKRVELLPV